MKRKQRKRLSKLWKQKQRRKRLRALSSIPPTMPTDPTTEPTEPTGIDPTTATTAILVECYPIGIAWSNEDECFIAELSAFDVQVHHEEWQGAIDLAKEAQRMLIESYRAQSYELPSL